MSGGAVVVFGWAAFNALRTAVLVGYSIADPFPLIVYATGVTLVALFGAAVLLAGRRAIPAGPYRVATRSTSAAFLAAAAGFFGLGFTYGTWLMVVAIVPLVATIVLASRERIPAGVEPAVDERTGETPAATVPVDLPRPSGRRRR